MSAISIKQLLEAGVHFGHQTRSWNPKMKDYIFGERSGIHIIDLQQTMRHFQEALGFITELGAEGKTILFVGTKRQAREAIEEEARRCDMFFVTNRWLGGLLTNFTTIQNSIKRYKELESMKESGFYDKLSKKEVAQLERERKKLDKNLQGIRDMAQLPDAVFIVDAENESIAVKEASTLGIPIIAVVDTNCDPDDIDYVIPGNDDALRSVKLFTSAIAEAVLAGRTIWEARVAAEKKAAQKAAEERAAAEKEAAEKKAAEKEAAEAKAAEKKAAEKKAAEEAEQAKQQAEKKKGEVPPEESKAAPEKTADKSPESESAPAKSEKEKVKKSAAKKKKAAVREAPVVEEEVAAETEAEEPTAKKEADEAPKASKSKKKKSKKADAKAATEEEASATAESADKTKKADEAAEEEKVEAE